MRELRKVAVRGNNIDTEGLWDLLAHGRRKPAA
jgi:hypothetical protein